jgi:arylsulfatase A-like enzyme
MTFSSAAWLGEQITKGTKTMTKVMTTAASLATLCSVAAAEEPALSPPEGRPNILFIMADDLGWRDTAVYGSTFYETPHIDALAASGVRFTDAYAANPLCSPTRASIMTGQYPVRHGLTTAAGHVAKIQEHKERTHGPEEIRGSGPSHLNYLDPAHYTLGKAMRDAGYATGFFGKWHMGCKLEHWPESHGFDHVHTISLQHLRHPRDKLRGGLFSKPKGW